MSDPSNVMKAASLASEAQKKLDEASKDPVDKKED